MTAARKPDTFPPGTRGWCVALACTLEASAPKPGNVHPLVAYPDLSHAELVAAGHAIAAVLDSAPSRRLGATIRAAVEASRGLTRSNANLGIVLAELGDPAGALAQPTCGGPAGILRPTSRSSPRGSRSGRARR